MGKKSPSIAVIWMYQGKNAEERRAEIEQFDYPNFTVVNGIREIPEKTDICVFWMDDDKPVAKTFLREMATPLIAGDDFRAVMHFWSGNAISLPKTMLDATSLADGHGSVQSLLQLLLPVLDITEKGPNGRVHLAFSSTERLAPLSMEPVGFPS